jgi:hypothetical protein
VTPPSGWTVPPPPPRGDRPIRGWRVTGGFAIAFVGHLLTVALAVPTLTGSGNQSMNWLVAALIAQAALFVACLTVGIVLLVRGDRGLGLGLIIGWAVGLIVLPVIGFGACVVALRSMGSG